jgi:hypothetical protein
MPGYVQFWDVGNHYFSEEPGVSSGLEITVPAYKGFMSLLLLLR